MPAMTPAERRLSIWLRAWAPTFAAGAGLFYLLPGRTTASLNASARRVGLQESPVDADNLWVVLAAAYMALITGLAQQAAPKPLARQDLVRFLMLGKAASSLGALGYFLFRRRAYAFLLNFAVDGAILALTYKLLTDAQEAARATRAA
jgi:hypothetical protein